MATMRFSRVSVVLAPSISRTYSFCWVKGSLGPKLPGLEIAGDDLFQVSGQLDCWPVFVEFHNHGDDITRLALSTSA